MILVIAVALWIVWVAPYVLRNGRHQLQPAGEFLADVIDMEPADPHAGKVMKMAAQQEKPMISTQRAEPARGSRGEAYSTKKRQANRKGDASSLLVTSVGAVASAQTEQRQDGEDHNDHADQVEDRVHLSIS